MVDNVGRTEFFLKLPHVAPKSDEEHRANQLELERWGNALPTDENPPGITVLYGTRSFAMSTDGRAVYLVGGAAAYPSSRVTAYVIFPGSGNIELPYLVPAGQPGSVTWSPVIVIPYPGFYQVTYNIKVTGFSDASESMYAGFSRFGFRGDNSGDTDDDRYYDGIVLGPQQHGNFRGFDARNGSGHPEDPDGDVAFSGSYLTDFYVGAGSGSEMPSGIFPWVKNPSGRTALSIRWTGHVTLTYVAPSQTDYVPPWDLPPA